MTPSLEQDARTAADELPPALSSMWRLCKLGYRHEPRLMLAAFVLSQLAALPDALLALWLMFLGQGVLEQRPGLVQLSAIGLGVSAVATWFLRTVSTRVQRRFRDKVTIALESHVARLQATVATIATTNVPTISIGSRYCATRCSCSTISTCLCSRPADGFCGSGSRSRCSSRSTLLLPFWPYSRFPQYSPLRGDPQSSARPRNPAHNPAGSRGISSRLRRPPRPAKTCASCESEAG